MDYAHPERAQRLAAEYALGSLRGGARRRFERLLPSHPALAAATAHWQERLQLLAGQVEPVTPPARVWLAVQTRLFGAANDAQATRPGSTRLRLWQGFSAVALAASIVMALQLARPQPEAAPVVVVLRSTPEGLERLMTGFVASVSADGRALVLRPLVPLTQQPGRALELWALTGTGAGRRRAHHRPACRPAGRHPGLRRQPGAGGRLAHRPPDRSYRVGRRNLGHSTVTDFAKLRGLSTSVPRAQAV